MVRGQSSLGPQKKNSGGIIQFSLNQLMEEFILLSAPAALEPRHLNDLSAVSFFPQWKLLLGPRWTAELFFFNVAKAQKSNTLLMAAWIPHLQVTLILTLVSSNTHAHQPMNHSSFFSQLSEIPYSSWVSQALIHGPTYTYIQLLL